VADEIKGDEKKSPLFSQIITSVAIAILVGGTSPWWFNEFFNKPAPKPSPTEITANHQEPTVNPQQSAPVASSDFFVGRWRVDQVVGSVSGGNVVDYFKNGRFEGQQLMVSGNMGQKIGESGVWEVEKLSNQSFRLKLVFDNGTQWTGKFRIIDQNHIHNVDENYVAERVE
jgi:hypothetical protein